MTFRTSQDPRSISNQGTLLDLSAQTKRMKWCRSLKNLVSNPPRLYPLPQGMRTKVSFFPFFFLSFYFLQPIFVCKKQHQQRRKKKNINADAHHPIALPATFRPKCTVFECLSYFVNLRSVHRKSFYRILAEHTTDPKEKYYLMYLCSRAGTCFHIIILFHHFVVGSIFIPIFVLLPALSFKQEWRNSIN